MTSIRDQRSEGIRLAVRRLPDVIDTLVNAGFAETYPAPHERIRMLDDNGTMVAIRTDGTLVVGGAGRETVVRALRAGGGVQ
jgi:hypothetical protein